MTSHDMEAYDIRSQAIERFRSNAAIADGSPYAEWGAEVPDLIYEEVLDALNELESALVDDDDEERERIAGLVVDRAVHAALAYALHVGMLSAPAAPAQPVRFQTHNPATGEAYKCVECGEDRHEGSCESGKGGR